MVEQPQSHMQTSSDKQSISLRALLIYRLASPTRRQLMPASLQFGALETDWPQMPPVHGKKLIIIRVSLASGLEAHRNIAAYFPNQPQGLETTRPRMQLEPLPGHGHKEVVIMACLSPSLRAPEGLRNMARWVLLLVTQFIQFQLSMREWEVLYVLEVFFPRFLRFEVVGTVASTHGQ